MRKTPLEDEKERSNSRIAKFPGAGSGGVDAAGVLDSRMLPDRELLLNGTR